MSEDLRLTTHEESTEHDDEETMTLIPNKDHDDETQKSNSSPRISIIASRISGNRKPLIVMVLLQVILIILLLLSITGGDEVTTKITSSYSVKTVAQKKVKDWKANIPTLLSKLSTVNIPTRDKPFIFFHPRKSGGSNMRSLLYEEAKRHNIDSWIPCLNEKCIPYSLPPPSDTKSSIFAGHINFMQMTQIMRETRLQGPLLKLKQPITLANGSNRTYHKLDDSYPLFDCVTFIRPTVSRVVSCWNYRMAKTMNKVFQMPRSNELAPEDWSNLLPYAMDEYNNGCNNEYARIFGSTVHESQVNTLSPSEPSFLQELDNIASRISKCVILRMTDRCEDSDVIMHHFIPLMSNVSLCSKHEKPGVKSDGVSEESAAVILEQNYMDELIFDFASDLFEEQLKIATDSSTAYSL